MIMSMTVSYTMTQLMTTTKLTQICSDGDTTIPSAMDTTEHHISTKDLMPQATMIISTTMSTTD